MSKKFLSLLLIIITMSLSFSCALGETGGGTKIDCNILVNEGGSMTLLPSGNIGTVGKDIILGCMGLPGAFSGETSLTLSGSTGNDSIANVFPFQNNLGVNQDGSTDVVNFAIMILSPGSTDVAVDFFGEMISDVNSTLWTFNAAGAMSGSSTSSSSTSGSSPSSSSGSISSSSSSTSSTGGSASLCSSANSSCEATGSKNACRSCCSSGSKKCKSKCLKACKKIKIKK